MFTLRTALPDVKDTLGRADDFAEPFSEEQEVGVRLGGTLHDIHDGTAGTCS
jgi:hypothetical protein